MSTISTVEYRRVQPEDIPSVCRLLAENVPTEEYNCTICSCRGFAHYLLTTCRPASHAATRLIGAYANNRLVGFAEWRRMDRILFLNNLFTETAMRGIGIGNSLMTYGLSFAAEKGLSSVMLDVFSWNERAMQWYIRLGFEQMERTFWYKGTLADSLSDDERKPDYIVEDYPQAEAHHHAYGFSSLKIRAEDSSIQAGRLGDAYFRIFVPAGHWDDKAAYILRDLDPERSMLVLSPDPRLAERVPWLRKFSEAVRMKKTIF